MSRQLTMAIAGCAMALLCVSAFAQSTSSSAPAAGGTSGGTAGNESRNGEGRPAPMRAANPSRPVDTEGFVRQASQDGMAEVEAAKLAESKAQSNDVKDFARRMIADHTKANDELNGIAMRKGIKVASALDSKHKSMIDNLRSKSGGDFDASYKEGMAADHHKAVDLFQQASGSSNIDSDVRSFAEKTLPTLEQHKQMADTLENSGHAGRGTGH